MHFGGSAPYSLTLTSSTNLVTVIPGATYTLTVACGNRDDYEKAANQCKIELLTGGVSVASSGLIDESAISPPNQWQDFSVVWTAPGDASGQLKIRLTGAATYFGQAWFDDARLTYTLPARGIVTVPDGDFESGLTNWAIAKLTPNVVAGTDVASAIAPDPDTSGGKAAYVHWAGDVTYGLTLTSTNNLAAVIPRATYTLTVACGNRDDYLKAANQCKIELLTGGVSVASSALIDESAISPPDQWKDFPVVWKAPPTATGQLKIRLTGAATYSGQAWFDNVRLTYGTPWGTAAFFR